MQCNRDDNFWSRCGLAIGQGKNGLKCRTCHITRFSARWLRSRLKRGKVQDFFRLYSFTSIVFISFLPKYCGWYMPWATVGIQVKRPLYMALIK